MSEVLLDADIREPLFEYIEQRYGKVRFLEEKVTGKSRADVVVVLSDKVMGIEIKSDADSYTRLATQVKNYDKYYDENYLVIGSTHAHHAAEHVPPYWGIISVEMIDGRVDFYSIREALPNPKAKLKNKMSLLWKRELAEIQKQNGLPKYSNKSKKFIREFLIERIPEEELNRAISDLLFERDYTIFDEE